MLEKIKKIKESKIFRLISNILYTIMVIMVILMLLIVVMQRMTNNNITIGGFRLFSVATGSMVPVYNVGDILISKEINPSKIEIGDDLVYKGEKGTFKGKVVTHRVISIEEKEDGNYKIITKGIANKTEDPEINQTQVYGKVILKLHILSALGKLTRNTQTFYFIIIALVVILIYKNIKDIINRKAEQEDEDIEE